MALPGKWKLRVGDARGGASATLDDSSWETVDVGVFRPIASKSKQTVVWLRSSFVVPDDVDPGKLAIDLGARVGHSTVWLNGKKVGQSPMRNAPVLLPAPLPLQRGPNVVAIKLAFGNHVGGLRWSGDAAVGQADTRQRGMVTRTFKSALDGSSQTLGVYVPRCADLTLPRPLVVALPGWDGNIHGFTHSRLMSEAEKRGWIVLVPDPRGNVLYTGVSEQGVLEAIDTVSHDLAIDPDRVYLTGVSMGGAGALQIGYHYPDRFAAIAAFYGDSRYEPAGYVKAILVDQKTADRYSVLLFHHNARNFPVLLVHARDDKVSAFAQSKMLADADRSSGLDRHRLLAPDTGGHSLQVVEDAVDEMVALFDSSRRDKSPARVSFKTSAAQYSAAWWARVSIRREGDFGEIDLSVDRETRTLQAHTIDAGIAEVRVDLALAGLEADGDLALDVDKATQAPLVLVGLTNWKAARLKGGGQEQTLPVQDGLLRIARLAAGRWSVVGDKR
jgi:poly(3-hydroxybutyrate) depolymerase